MEQKVLRASTAFLLLALTVRLMGSTLPNQMAKLLTSPEAASVMLFLETGYTMKPVCIAFSKPDETAPPQAEQETTLPETPPEPVRQVFSAGEAELLELSGGVSCPVSMESLVASPLEWDLYGPGPQVLILHSHGSESYENTEGYQEEVAYRTVDTDYNMVSVGELLAQQLTEAGIGVVHDRTLHDQPSYTDAYASSRQAVQDYLARYPTIRLVLDLHRDSYADKLGKQMAYTAQSDAQTAQLMLVVGTDQGGLYHPGWQENLALGVKLQLQLERLCPGICRPVNLRTQRFNQDLSAGALLVEVGAAGNTRQQALRAAQVLAEAIVALAPGAN